MTPLRSPRATRITRSSLGARILGGGIALWLLSAASLALAQPGGGDFEGVRLEWEQIFSAGPDQAWSPFRVRVENRSDRNRDLAVVLETRSGARTGSVTWSLGSLAPGQQVFQVVPSFQPPASGMLQVQVRLLEEGRQLNPRSAPPLFPSRRFWNNSGWNQRTPRQRQRDDRPPYREVNVLMVVREEDDSVLEIRRDFTSALQRHSGASQLEFRVAILQPGELPLAGEAYEAVDRLVLVGVDPSDLPSPARRRALLGAVRGGLVAWIVPGKGGEGNGWLPVPMAVDRRASPGGDVTFFVSAEDPGDVVLRTPDPGSTPVAFRYREGLGEWRRVAALGLDEYPFQDSGFQPWARRARGHNVADEAHPGVQRQYSPSRLARRVYDRMVDLYRPPAQPVLVFLIIAVYLLGVGPLLFLYLRRRGKLIWLLWLQPLVVVLFLVFTVVIGYMTFGILDTSWQTVVVYQQRGRPEWGVGVSTLARYKAAAGAADVATEDGSLPVFFARDPDEWRSHSWRIDGDERRLEGFEFSQWSLSQFNARGTVRLGGEIEILSRSLPGFLTGPNRSLRVRNGYPFPIRGVMVWQPRASDGLRLIGNVPPGEEGELVPPPGRQGVPGGRTSPSGPWERLLSALLLTPHGFGTEPVCLVEFDPRDLPDGAGFRFQGEHAEDRGVLVVLEAER